MGVNKTTHAVAVALAATATLLSCSHPHERPVAEGALHSCEEFTLYPDSLISKDISIIPDADGNILEITSEGTSIAKPADTGNLNPTLSGCDTLLNYLFNTPSGICSTTYDCFAPYEIYIGDCLLNPDAARARLEKRIHHRGLLPIYTGFTQWPVVSSDAAWALPAREYYYLTGDEEWLRISSKALSQLIESDLQMTYDRSAAMFRGVDPLLLDGSLPPWMNAADLASLFCFATNTQRITACDYIAEAGKTLSAEKPLRYPLLRDSLAIAVETNFWLPDRGFFSQVLYGAPTMLRAAVSDNLSQAAAAISGAIPYPQAKRLMQSTPLPDNFIPAHWPSIPSVKERHRRQAITAAMWAIAAAKTRNIRGFALALSTLAYRSAADSFARDMFRAAYLRSLIGITPTAGGLQITPFIPELLAGDRKVSGLRYRDCTLDISVSGYGDVISTFTIDNEIAGNPVVPAHLSGHHHIGITLVGYSSPDSIADITQNTPQLPPTPTVKVIAPTKFAVSDNGADTTGIYLGEMLYTVCETGYIDIPLSDKVTTVSFVPVKGSTEGYAAKPCLYIPPRDSISINVAEFAPTGGKMLRDKDLAKKYAESTRFKNNALTFDFDAGKDGAGEYYVQIAYLNGLGIVNPERRYALRTLSVNDVTAGLFVLPQLSPDDWRYDVDWQTLVGVSLPIKVSLHAGINKLSVDYYHPPLYNFDHDSNTFIPVKIIITRIG